MQVFFAHLLLGEMNREIKGLRLQLNLKTLLRNRFSVQFHDLLFKRKVGSIAWRACAPPHTHTKKKKKKRGHSLWFCLWSTVNVQFFFFFFGSSRFCKCCTHGLVVEIFDVTCLYLMINVQKYPRLKDPNDSLFFFFLWSLLFLPIVRRVGSSSLGITFSSTSTPTI